MNKGIALKIEKISKKYLIGKQYDGTLRHSLSKLFTSGSSHLSEFWALKDVSFDVEVGDVVGVVGRNGAGKSTLLKILSEVTKPTNGRVLINGRVASLLEVGTGFHPELTGRENIFLNGTILGMSRKEIKSKFDEIVDFSGIEQFIDTAVKHYSSGMYVRLAFAVAAHLEPEILIVDEVLAVGDAEFQKRCLGKMKMVANTGRTVLFVSHNMAAVKLLCNKGVLMDKGTLVSQGGIEAITQQYLSSENDSGVYSPNEIKKNAELAFKEIKLKNESGFITTEFTCEDSIYIEFDFVVYNLNHPYSVFVIIKNKYGVPVFSAESKIKTDKLKLKISKNFLTRGAYHLHSFIHIPKIHQIDIAEDVCHFNITDTSSSFAIHDEYDYGNVFGNCVWE